MNAKKCGLLVAAFVLCCLASSAQAALISPFQFFPVPAPNSSTPFSDIYSNGSDGPSTNVTGNVVYNKTTHLFTADLTTQSFALGEYYLSQAVQSPNGQPAVYDSPTWNTGPWAETKVQINVDTIGALLNSSALSPNLTITGALNSDGSDFTTLLTANVVQFGYNLGHNSVFDLYFDVTGGIRANAMGGIGGQISMDLASPNATTPVWANGFTIGENQSADDLRGAAVPEPSSLLLLAGSALPLGLLRWRMARRARSKTDLS